MIKLVDKFKIQPTSVVVFKVSPPDEYSLADFIREKVLSRPDWEYIVSIPGKRRHNTYDEYYDWAVELATLAYAEYITARDIREIDVSLPTKEEARKPVACEIGWRYVYV